jgi:hypothetical protein
VRLAGAPFEGLPQRPSVAGLVVPNADWRAGSIQIRTNAAREYLLQIRVPSLEDAARTLLAEVTGERSPSDKGRLGMALQAKTDISALLEPGMYEAVAELTTPRSRQLERELRSLQRLALSGDSAEAVQLNELQEHRPCLSPERAILFNRPRWVGARPLPVTRLA